MRTLRDITIIVVEDDPLMRGNWGAPCSTKAIRSSRRRRRWIASSFSTRGARFDLLITKVALPPPHGLALGRMAKNRNPAQKVIYLCDATISLSEDERENANGPILPQPVLAEELLDAVGRLCASKDV